MATRTMTRTLRVDARQLLLLSTLLLTVGCTTMTKREYAPFVRDLDDANRLEISTYPADFPNRLTEKDALFEKFESADQLYFEVHVRDPSKSIGPNPNVRSITIHSFAYREGDDPEVVLLSEYPESFWMQGNPSHDQSGQPPIRYVPDGSVYIAIRFTLNETEYAFEGEMRARENRSTWPTIIAEQSI